MIGSNAGVKLTIPYTRPQVVSSFNAPSFKTQRRLQGHALISDSFAKGPNWTIAGGANRPGIEVWPGMGDNVHKDGYNVLYGDYHTVWHGDPEQRIIYWDMYDVGDTWGGAGGSDYYAGPDEAAGLRGTGSITASACWGWYSGTHHWMASAKESALLWNHFDRTVGVDVVDVQEYFEKPGTP